MTYDAQELARLIESSNSGSGAGAAPWPSDGGAYEASLIQDPSEEYWDDDDGSWSQCSLGPYLLPGLAKVTVESSRKLDIKPVPGSDGGHMTDKGYEGAKVTIEVVMWLKMHRDWLLDLLPNIHPRKPGKKRDAWDITHPGANIHGVRSVMVQRIKGPVVGSIHGTKELTIECVEWMPAPKSKSSVTATPKASTASGPPVSDDWYFTPRTVTLPTSGGPPVGSQRPVPNQTLLKP